MGKVFVTPSLENLGSIPETHINVEEENQLLFSFDFYTTAMA